MAAVTSLLLLLSTIAANALPPDSQPVPYTLPPELNAYHSSSDIVGDYDVPPCSPFIPPLGEMRCPPNSHYESCGPVCPESCIQYHCPLNCCVEGCFCDEGFVMGFNGFCIREEQCFDDSSVELANRGSPSVHPRECGTNEYIGCDSLNERDCWNYRDAMPRSDDCKLGCICTPPMIRGPDGNCILPEQCPSTQISDAAVRDWTICNFMRVINPDADCVMRARQCDNPEGCSDDDDEDHSRIRNRMDKELKPCYPDLKPEPVECPPGEEFVECGPICFASCVEYDCPLRCCVSGCYCPEGYVRGPRGVCIPKEECPVEKVSLSNDIFDTHAPAPVACGPEEIISCDSHCQTNCTNYHSEFVPCTDACILGCVCRPPKIRGHEGDCVLPEQCHPTAPMQPDEVSKLDMMKNFIQIRENALQQSPMKSQIFKCLRRHEILNMCTYTCPDTCDNYQDTFRTCKKVCLPIPRCDCEEGYVRGPSGDCITPEECPNEARTPEDCTGLEYYDPCGPACEVNCTSYYDMNKVCENEGCKAGCFCKRGLVRGPDGKCMWPFECFVRSPQLLKHHRSTLEQNVCPENEEWQSCGTACPKNCTNYDEPIPCIEMCSQGCFCKEPLVRGPDGRCILVEECPSMLRASRKSVCPENEEWDFSCTYCPKDCTNYDKNISCLQICAAGCFCKEPYVKGPDGRCISTDQCPPVLKATPVCPENEYYEECEANCERNCTNYDQKISCSSFCRSGCVCKPPLVRGPDSTCVSVEECPEMKKEERGSLIDRLWSVRQIPAYMCKENEVFTFCKSICPDNCNNYKEDRFCRHICLPGCACRPGYILSRDGVCIKQEHCVDDRPEDCSELEEFNECGSYCETDCFNFNMASRDCYTKECRKGCFCKPGWVRSPEMKCIRPYECPRRSNNAFRHGGREWPM